jgi:hypothetical protein
MSTDPLSEKLLTKLQYISFLGGEEGESGGKTRSEMFLSSQTYIHKLVKSQHYLQVGQFMCFL